MMNSNSLNFRN